MLGPVKKFGAAVALSTALSFLISPAVLAQDHDQDHKQSDDNHNYASNRYYQTGQHEGEVDRGRNKQRKSHKHKYTSDDDRRAHDAGYQTGWQGDQQSDQHGEHHPQ